ncbi:MAG: hypothetical protein PHR28_03505, partial [candidate division Zixibacteria bacterium]|nr:hypothetical protein [candidate division Zixibacteria bacterium]
MELVVSRRPLWFLTATLTILLVLSATAIASEPFQAQVKPAITVGKTTGNISINGVLDDPGWKNAARFDNFAETQPGNNTKPEVQTDVLVTYDAEKLYVGFVCYDDHPDQIRATMSQRDRYSGDDAVFVCLD